MSSAPSGPPEASETPATEWYADGLRFECTQCGNCCTGPPGFVWFTEEEGRAIAATLGIDEKTLYRRFARRVDGHWSLNEHQTEHGYDCVFLDRQTSPGKALCKIYKTRPRQCRTWPFWRENLGTPRAWATTRLQTPCPGMDQGRVVPLVEIRVLRDGGGREQ